MTYPIECHVLGQTDRIEIDGPNNPYSRVTVDPETARILAQNLRVTADRADPSTAPSEVSYDEYRDAVKAVAEILDHALVQFDTGDLDNLERSLQAIDGRVRDLVEPEANCLQQD